MPPPKVTFVNSSEVIVAWNAKDFDHGGPIQVYQINLTSQFLQQSQIVNYNVMDSNPQMNTRISLDLMAGGEDWLPNCENQSSNTNLYNFSIRAVTKDEQKPYYGPWSLVEVVPAYCYSKSTPCKFISYK